MSAIGDMSAELEAMGMGISNPMGDFISFSMAIPAGPRRGKIIRIAFQVPGDFPATPPPGPHVSPRLGHPDGAVHASALGADWEYWSRPFPNWTSTDKTASDYMAHIRLLLSQLQ